MTQTSHILIRTVGKPRTTRVCSAAPGDKYGDAETANEMKMVSCQVSKFRVLGSFFLAYLATEKLLYLWSQEPDPKHVREPAQEFMDMIQLKPMTKSEFQSYYEHLIANYAEDHVRGGRWSAEEAHEQATKEIQALLTDGVATQDQYLNILKDSSTQAAVGILWYAIQSQAGKKVAFIYDIEIYPIFRRQGYATKALQSLEDQARTSGAREIRLHVFGHNEGAQELYKKIGYVMTNVMMAKSLEA